MTYIVVENNQTCGKVTVDRRTEKKSFSNEIIVSTQQSMHLAAHPTDNWTIKKQQTIDSVRSSQKRIIEAIEVLGQLLHVTGGKHQLHMRWINYIPVLTKRQETWYHWCANSSFRVISLVMIQYYLVMKISRNFPMLTDCIRENKKGPL